MVVLPAGRPASRESSINPVIGAILGRRSIREGFDPRVVDRDNLDLILACGTAAPSSKNAAPWRFHVVHDASRLVSVAEAAVSSAHIDDWVPFDPRQGAEQLPWQSSVVESAEALLKAPTAIVIENRGVFGGGHRGIDGAEPTARESALKGYAFECIGLGSALENMWLAANSLGLAVAFLGDLAIAEDHIQDLLGIEGDVMGILILGHSDAKPFPRRPAPPASQTDSPVVWH